MTAAVDIWAGFEEPDAAEWSMIGDDGAAGSASVCSFIPRQDANPCEEDGSYSMQRKTSGMWYALCVRHTAYVREELGSDVAAVKDVRPVGVRDEDHHAALSDWVERYRRGEVR